MMIRRIRVTSAKNIINFSNYVNHRMVVQKRFYSQNTNQTNTKSLKSAILLLGLGGVGYGIGRIRREFVNEQEVAFREISSEDLDPQGTVTEKVYMDIRVQHDHPASTNKDNQEQTVANTNKKKTIQDKTGRVIIGLYGRDYPQLVKQFGDLCDGTYQNPQDNLHTNANHGVISNPNMYTYKDTSFELIIPDSLCKGGTNVKLVKGSKNNEFNAENTSNSAFPVSESSIATDSEPNFQYKPRKYRHKKFGVVSTTCTETSIQTTPCTDFLITFREIAYLDDGMVGNILSKFAADTKKTTEVEYQEVGKEASSKYTVIGQVMYNGNDILQHVEHIGSITGQPTKNSHHSIEACGRLPPMSKAIEVASDEIIDKHGKNINQLIN